jgi:predicted GH43/DUF377 family glycosyl hydrolase
MRHANNPLIKPSDIPGGAACVFNSGATFYQGKVILLLSVWDRQWVPHFYVADSADGIHFTVSHDSGIAPPGEFPYVPHEGIFDTRITELDGRYLITYNVGSSYGGRIMLVETRDFVKFSEFGFITPPDHRNCVIFPEIIKGNYVRLERPNVNDAGDIYISRSPDLIHWGRTELLLARNARYWESAKIGPGAPPIKTDKGWLVIYHGARSGMNGYIYNAGCLLLDLEDPGRIVGKCQEPILSPQADYEQVGITPNVVFPTGAVVHGQPGELKVYYGAADTVMAMATGEISELTAACV